MLDKVKLGKIVGLGNVSNDETLLASYARDNSFANTLRPRLVVKPQNRDEIEKIVKLARETQTPLVPVSSGPPHFRGDTIPNVPEAVIIDLSQLKQIIRVDRENRVAMCEPGVNFGEMISAVTKAGLRMNIPLLPRSTKSVVGSMLEREPVTMPKYHWDISDPICCMEVIFGTGEMFRTGEAAGPGTLEEQWESGGCQKEAAGPAQISLHRLIQGAQGTMGIVTWASTRCEVLPKLEEPYWVGNDSPAKLIEMARDLIKMRLVNECFILNRTNLAAMTAKAISKDYESFKATLPSWLLFFTIAGYNYWPEKRVEGQTQDMHSIAQRLGIEPKRSLKNLTALEYLGLIKAPSDDPYWKLRLKGNCEDIFFISNFDKLEELVDIMQRLTLESGYPVADLGVYIQPIVQGVNYHCEFNLPYDSNNKIESEIVRKLCANAINELMNHGAFFSRPIGESTPLIMNRDAGTVWALKKVKRILDPDDIMNPGKLCFSSK